MDRSQRIVFFVVLPLLLLFVVTVGWFIYRLPFRSTADTQFGDQHLKTTVALVELHRLRYGRYPSTLSELKFLGNWDPIAISSMSYRVNSEGTRYCVEVQRGWIGKPKLELPQEFGEEQGMKHRFANRWFDHKYGRAFREKMNNAKRRDLRC